MKVIPKLAAVLLVACPTCFGHASEAASTCTSPQGQIAKTLMKISPYLEVGIKSKFYNLTKGLSAENSTQTGCIFTYASFLETPPDGSTNTSISFEEANVAALKAEFVLIPKIVKGPDGPVRKGMTERLEVTLTFRDPVTLKNVTKPEQKGPVASDRSEFILSPKEDAKSILENDGFSVPTVTRLPNS